MLFSIIKYFNQYKILISIASFFSIYKALYLLNLSINPLIYQIAIVIATLIVYNQNQIFHNKNKISINLSKSNRHLPLIIVLAFGAIFAILSFIFKYGFRKEILLGILFLPSFFYQIPIISFKGKTLAVRQMPYFKIFLISFVWSYVATLMVFIPIESPKFLHAAIILTMNFIFILSITIPFDVRDKVLDRFNELKTLSHLFNDRLLVITSISLAIINFIVSSLYIITFSDPILILPEIGIIIYLLLLYSNFEKLKNKDYYYELLDFSILLYGALYLFIRLIFL
ncbi:MAG TPA: hypothetical protein PLE30_10540 [Candidatus Kapabacteria bacterium]|nr:hypothetical protein [Candidatus Kapabacteria bacterium]